MKVTETVHFGLGTECRQGLNHDESSGLIGLIQVSWYRHDKNKANILMDVVLF